MTSPPQSVLVVSLRYFGDVLLTTSLIRTLRRGFAGAAIDVLLAAGTEEMLEGNPDVREVVTVAERPGIDGYRALIRRLARRYDLAVIAETGDRPHFYGYIAARRRAGLLPEAFGKRWWKAALVRRGVPFAEHEPRVDGYRRLAQALALPYVAELVAPTAGIAASAWKARIGLDATRDAYAVLHLAPRFAYKRWHAEGWRSLIAWLDAKRLRIAVTGGKAPDERDYVRRVLGGSAVPVIDATGALRFGETADLLRGAALYVGPDTATSHLAAACGTPAVILFGPTDPTLWGPLPREGLDRPYAAVAASQRRGNVLLLQEPTLPCVPCQREGCEHHRESHSACLDAMSAARVIDAVREMTEV
jgi:heptosyltransferase-3